MDLKETADVKEEIECTRTSNFVGKSLVCTGFTTKSVKGIPKVDFIHLCCYSPEQLKETEKGICPVRSMLSMTPSEALSLSLGLIRASILFEDKCLKELEKK